MGSTGKIGISTGLRKVAEMIKGIGGLSGMSGLSGTIAVESLIFLKLNQVFPAF